MRTVPFSPIDATTNLAQSIQVARVRRATQMISRIPHGFCPCGEGQKPRVRHHKVNDRPLGIRGHPTLFYSPMTLCVRQKRKTEAEKELPTFPQAIKSTPKFQPRRLDLWTMPLPLGRACCHISPNPWKRGVKKRHPESRHCEAPSGA